VHFAGVDAVAAAATMSEQEWDFVLDVNITVVALSVVAYTAMTDRFLATLSDNERAAYERRLKSGPLVAAG
jgi:hypothetical protein